MKKIKEEKTLEQIQEIVTDGGSGQIERIITQNYRFIFPPEKRPAENNYIQRGDAFRFDCQDEGGIPSHPRATIWKPGVERPTYSEIVPVGCIQSTIQ